MHSLLPPCIVNHRVCLEISVFGCAGQLKLGRAGNYCFSQSGLAAGVEDAAARGAITSSSSADAAAHGANMAVDGNSNTFWVALFSSLSVPQ